MDYDAPKPAIVETKDRPAKAAPVQPASSAGKLAKVSAAKWGSPEAHRIGQKVALSNPDQTMGAFSGGSQAEPVKLPNNQGGAARREGGTVEQDVEKQNLSDDELLAMIFQRARCRPRLRAKVRKMAESFQEAADPAISLPDRAPRLWAERPDIERDMNPAAWIRLVYAPWLGHGLARHHVGERDPELGQRYSNWTRKGRHPEDIIKEFAEGNPYGRLDDGEAGRRHRENTKASKIKAKTVKMSQRLAMT